MLIIYALVQSGSLVSAEEALKAAVEQYMECKSD